jgi:enamine deaminase RidA (YjgF/YER057c/UK114 family)
LSGQIGVAPDGSLATHFEAQCEVAMTNVETLLTAAAMKLVVAALARPELLIEIDVTAASAN